MSASKMTSGICVCTVVTLLTGNSQQQLTDPTRGARIDAFDFVMRLNQAPTEGFEAYVGMVEWPK